MVADLRRPPAFRKAGQVKMEAPGLWPIQWLGQRSATLSNTLFPSGPPQEHGSLIQTPDLPDETGLRLIAQRTFVHLPTLSSHNTFSDAHQHLCQKGKSQPPSPLVTSVLVARHIVRTNDADEYVHIVPEIFIMYNISISSIIASRYLVVFICTECLTSSMLLLKSPV